MAERRRDVKRKMKLLEVRRGRRRAKEKWAAERVMPEVRESQSGPPASCFQPSLHVSDQEIREIPLRYD